MSNPENSAENTYELTENFASSQSSWNEVKTAGKNVVEASSTIYAKNSRFLLFVDNDLKTPQEFDNLVTKNGAVYEMEVQPGETYVIQGKSRNNYVPGLDYTSAFSSQFSESGDGDKITPTGVKIIQGLGDFKEGTLTGVANPDAGVFQGIPLIFTENDAKFGLYQGGQLTNEKSLKEGEWEENPFEFQDYQYDITKFAVKRQEGNLYGSGSQRLYLKLRNLDGKEKYLKVGEVGDDQNPAIDNFNLFNTVRVEVSEERNSPFTFSTGPIQFFNEGRVDVPTRRKRSTKRDLPVNSTFGDTTGTVIAVYRKNPDNVEVPIQMRCAGKAETNGRIEIREIHRDFVNFGTIDPDDDANWGPPALLRQRETGLQELDIQPGDVTISSSNNRAEGEQGTVVEYDGQATSGGSSQPRSSEDAERANEYHYFVATARHQSTAENIVRYDLLTEEEW